MLCIFYLYSNINRPIQKNLLIGFRLKKNLFFQFLDYLNQNPYQNCEFCFLFQVHSFLIYIFYKFYLFFKLKKFKLKFNY